MTALVLLALSTLLGAPAGAAPVVLTIEVAGDGRVVGVGNGPEKGLVCASAKCETTVADPAAEMVFAAVPGTNTLFRDWGGRPDTFVCAPGPQDSQSTCRVKMQDLLGKPRSGTVIAQFGGTLDPGYVAPTPEQLAAAQTSGAALAEPDRTRVINWMARRAAAAKQPYCYKNTSYRGAGSPLSTCPAGQDKSGLLCYPNCRDGYDGVGPVCWQSCPSGYVDTGAFCHVDKALTRSGTWKCPHWYSCHKVCPSGYTNVGLFCALTPPDNPPGWKGDGLDLIKDSYGRGAGYPMQCKASEEQQAALCYPRCREGYTGVLDRCWQTCPSGTTDCLSGCANSATQCAESTINMVVSPLMLAFNILTFGSSSEMEAASAEIKSALAAKDAKGGAAALGRYLEASAAELERMTTREVANTLKEKFSENAAKWCAKEFIKVQYYMRVKKDDDAQALAFAKDLAGLDPTGVAGVVAAYANPKCAAPEPFPVVVPLY